MKKVANKIINKTTNKTIKKANLPSKTCPVCKRPFTWRKKWEDVWDEVVYCSKRCSGNKNKATPI